MKRTRRFLLSFAFSALFASMFSQGLGCQVALRADADNIRCALPEGAPCPGTDRTCQGGFCRVCVPKPEECNGVDDNCNGIVDEGFDNDNDGYKTCGQKGEIDCDDSPETGRDIHPGADEICNGIDDNCDGKIDENAIDCAADQECWAEKGICTIKDDCRIHGCTNGGCDPDTGTCTQADCVALGRCNVPGTACDPKLRRCIKEIGYGESCDDSVRCSSGYLCVDTATVALTQRPGSICTRTCCESTDCPSGSVCRTATNGASVCVLASDLNISLGTKSAFSSCSVNGDCRSGSCNTTTKLCLDGCCGTFSCGTGGRCVLGADKKFLCRASASTATLDIGKTCSTSSSCKSGVCMEDYSGLSGFCSQKCCSSKDCPSYDYKCDPVDAGGSIVNVCVQFGPSEFPGTRLGGDTCSKDEDCRSASCVDGRCNDMCCRDSDCEGGTKCKPKKESFGYTMRCTVVD